MQQITDTLQNHDDLVQHDFNEKQARALAQVTENSMQAVLDRIDKRFEQIDKRFDAFQADVDKRFEQVDKRFNTMQWLIGLSVAVLVLVRFFS